MTTQNFSMEHINTPIGRLIVITDDQHNLRATDWEGYEARMQTLLRRHYGASAYQLTESQTRSAAARRIEDYFAGNIDALCGIKTKTNGTDFQRSVWQALRQIPHGETTSYGALAARINRPKAARAVGFANGSNPICIVVPCHRVIGADASLTGFAGGLPRKRWLLNHEAAFCT